MDFSFNSKKGTLIKKYIFPLLSGLLYAFAWSYESLFFLQLISFVPLLFAINTIRKSDKKFINKLGELFIASALYRTPIVFIVLIWVLDISLVALIILSITETFLFATATCILLIKKIPDYAMICILVLYELLMQNVTLLVPSYQLGYSWGHFIELIQYYSFLGIEGGALIIILFNFALYMWIKSKKLKAFSIVSFSLFLGLTVFSVFKFYLSEPQKLDKSANISIIHSHFQPNGDNYRKNQIALMDSASQIASPNSLVILPEVFFNSFGWLESLSNNKIIKHVDEIRNKKNQTYLVGAYIFSQTTNPSPQSKYLESYKIHYNSHNTSILLGDVTRLKSKKLFIPFYEYVPDNKITQWINKYVTDIGDDRKVTVLEQDDRFSYKGKRFNSVLCYESVFPVYAANLAKNNQFLVVQTNEAWNINQLLSEQYLKINRAIAIQIGIPVYRASNHGYSAIISPNGTAKLESSTDTSFTLLEGNLPLNGQTSFYCNITGYSYWLGGIFLFYFVFVGIIRSLNTTESRRGIK